MKRIRVQEFGGPEVLRLEEVADLRPGIGEVLVRVKAAGVNPYDTYMRSGNYGARTPTLPFTPGSDAAGVIEAVGAQVSDLTPGDRVYTTGTLTGAYAELALCTRAQVQPLPDKVSFTQGAGLFVPYATAYRALFQVARATKPDFVLIHGASGGVGIAAVQFARAAGLTIIGTAGTEAGLQRIRQEGVRHALDHRAPGYVQEILQLMNDRGVDVILEMLANVNLRNDLKMLATGGRVVVIGSRGNVQITPRDLMQREASVTGLMLWNTPEEQLKKAYRAIHAGLEDGSLHPVIGHEVPLAEAAQAHRRVMEPGARGKVVITI